MESFNDFVKDMVYYANAMSEIQTKKCLKCMVQFQDAKICIIWVSLFCLYDIKHYYRHLKRLKCRHFYLLLSSNKLSLLNKY